MNSSTTATTMTTPFNSTIGVTPRLRLTRNAMFDSSKTANINDFSLPDRSSSPLASSSKTPIPARDTVELDSPASRLRALLSRVSTQNSRSSLSAQHNYGSYAAAESDFLDDASQSQADNNFGSSQTNTSLAQESLRDLFSRAKHDTPQKDKTPRLRRRNSDSAGASAEFGPRSNGDSVLKGRKKSMSDEEVDMDVNGSPSFALPNSFRYSASSAPFATSTPPASRSAFHTRSRSQSPSQLQFMSRSNLLEQDSSMQRALMEDDFSTDDLSEPDVGKGKGKAKSVSPTMRSAGTSRISEPNFEDSLPDSPAQVPSTSLHRSWHRRNIEDDRRSNSSASSGSRSSLLRQRQSPLPSVIEDRSPSPPLRSLNSRLSTTPSATPRPTTPSTVKAAPARPTTPSTARPFLANRPSATPSIATPSVRRRRDSVSASVDDDERRLMKAIGTPIPSSSPPPSDPSPPPSRSASPVVSTRRTPSTPRYTSRASASPPSSPPVLHANSAINLSPRTPAAAPTSILSTPSKPSVTASPRTPGNGSSTSVLSTPQSVRRSFSPRNRPPSPSFELDNESLPSLPPSSDEGGLDQNVRGSPNGRHPIDSYIDEEEEDDNSNEQFQSFRSRSSGITRRDDSTPMSFASAIDSNNFGSRESSNVLGESTTSLPAASPSTSRMSLKKLLQPPQTPAPPGAYNFSRYDPNTPAPPSNGRTLGADLAERDNSRLPVTPNGFGLPPASTTMMPTPAPPGAFKSYRHHRTPSPVEESTSNILPEPSADGGFRFPSETPFRGMKTPKPPGAWAATPALVGTSTKRGLYNVRFETTVEESSMERSQVLPDQHKIEIPDFNASFEDSSVKNEEIEQPNGRADATQDPSSSTSTITSTLGSAKRSSHRRTPSVRIVDQFGKEDTSSTSTNDSPTKKRRKTRVNMVDAMGREMPEEEEKPVSAFGEKDARDEEWDAMFASWDEPEDKDKKNLRQDTTRRVRMGLAHLAKDLDELQSFEKDNEQESRRLLELRKQSEEARNRRKQIEHDLQVAANAQPKRKSGKIVTGSVWTCKFIFSLIVLQILLGLFMFRYANIRARTIFLTTYYDSFYGNLHLFTSRSLSREQYLSTSISDTPGANSTSLADSPMYTFVASGAKASFQIMVLLVDAMDLIFQYFTGSSSEAVETISWPPI